MNGSILEKKISALNSFRECIYIHQDYDYKKNNMQILVEHLNIIFLPIIRKFLDLARVYDMEFAFDLHGDYNLLLKIIQSVVKRVDHYEEKDEYPLNIALEMRFMGYRYNAIRDRILLVFYPYRIFS